MFDEEDDDEDIEDLEWSFIGASMPTREKIVLLPPVPERLGGVWSTKSFHANTFAATFKYSVVPSPIASQKTQQTSDLGWGIYFIDAKNQPVPDTGPNLMKFPKNTSFQQQLKSKGLGFYGMANKWHGFGVIFRSYVNGQWNPTISIVTNERNATDYGVTQVPLIPKG